MVIIKWTISIAGSEFNHEQNRSIVLNFNTLYEYDHDSTVNSTLVQLNHALLTILESKTVLQTVLQKIIIVITIVSSGYFVRLTVVFQYAYNSVPFTVVRD